jgi:hypothetical protein
MSWRTWPVRCWYRSVIDVCDQPHDVHHGALGDSEHEQHRRRRVPGIVQSGLPDAGVVEQLFPVAVVGWVSPLGWANTQPPSCHSDPASSRSAA